MKQLLLLLFFVRLLDFLALAAGPSYHRHRVPHVPVPASHERTSVRMRDLGQIFSPSYFIPHPSDRTASSLVDGGPAMAGNLARKKVKKANK